MSQFVCLVAWDCGEIIPIDEFNCKVLSYKSDIMNYNPISAISYIKGQVANEKKDESCPFRILSPEIMSFVAARNIVAYKEHSLPDSGAFESTLRVRDVASTSS